MSYFKKDKRAYLLLADGSIYQGYHFGCEGTTIGEIVFTTGMTGYQEVLTDPSYCGQIVMQTYPLIGNYGINSSDMESSKSWVNGYIVREWCEAPSNFREAGTIDAFLKSQGKVGIWDVDTRQLTRKIRRQGTMNGAITTEDVYAHKDELLEKIRSYKIVNPVPKVSVSKLDWYYERENRANHVALMDFGYKHNILEKLLQFGCNVTVMPWDATIEDIRELNPDGIMLSNGPGDPTDNVKVIDNIKRFIDYGKPIFGICLGHQLMALATGADTFKMKYGHRGGNHPVRDLTGDGRVYMTSQNHGYAVDPDTVDPSVAVPAFENVNDGTNEGLRYIRKPVFTVQFHPEACPGPQDANFLFDRFMKMMKGAKHA